MIEKLDDRSIAIPPYSKVCSECIHLTSGIDRTCRAFPERIPLAIWAGQIKHTDPYPGDHQIQYKKDPKFMDSDPSGL
jgi:hypothetical protein